MGNEILVFMATKVNPCLILKRILQEYWRAWMTEEEIEKLYPEFDQWWRKEKGYLTLNGVWLIKLWYEFLSKKE